MASAIARSFVILSILCAVNGQQLSPNFYAQTCPNLLTIVRNAMRQAVNSEVRIGASILRLFFHDCFVNVRNYKPIWPPVSLIITCVP